MNWNKKNIGVGIILSVILIAVVQIVTDVASTPEYIRNGTKIYSKKTTTSSFFSRFSKMKKKIKKLENKNIFYHRKYVN